MERIPCFFGELEYIPRKYPGIGTTNYQLPTTNHQHDNDNKGKLLNRLITVYLMACSLDFYRCSTPRSKSSMLYLEMDDGGDITLDGVWGTKNGFRPWSLEKSWRFSFSCTL